MRLVLGPRSKKKTAAFAGVFFSVLKTVYLFAVLSRNGRLIAVVDVMVMSPRALIV